MKKKVQKSSVRITKIPVTGFIKAHNLVVGEDYSFKIVGNIRTTNKIDARLVRIVAEGERLTDEEVSNLVLRDVDFNQKFLLWKAEKSETYRRLEPTLERYVSSCISSVIKNFTQVRKVPLYLFKYPNGSYMSVPERNIIKVY